MIGQVYFPLVLGKHFKEKIGKLKQEVRQPSYWRSGYHASWAVRDDLVLGSGLRPREVLPSPQLGHGTLKIQRIRKTVPGGIWRTF